MPKSTATLNAELTSLSEGSARNRSRTPGGGRKKRTKYESKEDLTKSEIVEEVGAQLEINEDTPQDSSPMEIGAEQRWMEEDIDDETTAAAKKERKNRLKTHFKKNIEDCEATIKQVASVLDTHTITA